MQFFSPWVPNKLDDDYGEDFLITITEQKTKDVTENSFYIQNKATGKIKFRNGYVLLKN